VKLDPALHRHYWDKGWVVVEGVFPRDTAERAAQLALDIVNRDFDPQASSVKVDRSEDGKESAPRKLDTPLGRDSSFGKMIFSSPLPSLIEQLIGIKPILHSDQMFFKPPRHGSPKAYHQDNAYFLMHPDDHVLTAWIALDDVDEENGCLRYIDGSHLGPILPCEEVPGRPHDLTPADSLIDRSRESLARVKKGGVVFHHSKALHYSGPNRSPRWRRGYATHWIAADVWGENAVYNQSYFKKPEVWKGWGERYYEEATADIAKAFPDGVPVGNLAVRG
jgi:phytanoyl-CoA hydroxylase